MNPRSPDLFDPVTNHPRRISWSRWLLYAGGVLLVLGGLMYVWMVSYVTITVAPDTTVLTGPLLADGYPDYVGYLDAQNAAGVKPEENAWIAILRCCGPEEIDKELRAEHFRRLGIDPLPENGPYYRPFYDSPEKQIFPEPVLIAASSAAQLPWHTRFVRLAALNAERAANKPPELPEPFEDTLAMHLEQTAQAATLVAAAFAEDPESASLEYQFAVESPYINEDDEKIQDLRPAALAQIKPAFDTPEEDAAWRRELFDSARTELWLREELIMSERPWTRAECPLGAAWVEANSPQLDQLQKELPQRKKYYVPYVQQPEHPNVIGAMLPAIQLQRHLALSYAYRANLYIGEQNIPAALDDLISILQLGALIPQHPDMVEELVGVAIEGIGYARLQLLIHSPEITDEQLAEIEIRLSKIVHQFDMVDCLDHTERLKSIGQVVATIARGDKDYLQYGEEKDNPHWERKLVHWDSVLRELNARYDAYRDAAKTKQFAVVQQVEQAQPTRNKELEELYKNPPWYLLPSKQTEIVKYKYSDSFLPALSASTSASMKGTVRRDLVRIMLALERFRRANNAYPAALTELVPKYLPAVPTDPFDGQPIKYRRTRKGGYRAYSVWQNGVDDGGKPNVDRNGDPDGYFGNDLVIGSPDVLTPQQNLAW